MQTLKTVARNIRGHKLKKILFWKLFCSITVFVLQVATVCMYVKRLGHTTQSLMSWSELCHFNKLLFRMVNVAMLNV